MNLYAFAGNNPIAVADPDGHDDEFDSFGGQPGGDLNTMLEAEKGDAGAAYNEFQAAYAMMGRLMADQGMEVPDELGEAQQQSGDKPAPQPAPTGADGKPTPPPVAVPGCADCRWVWSPDKQNPRGGRWVPDNYPKTPGGIPGASWDPGGHWDVDTGNGPRGRYLPDGTPITPGQAHPPRSPMDSVGDWLNDRWQGFKQYLRDHPYGPNSSPGPYVPPVVPIPVPVIP